MARGYLHFRKSDNAVLIWDDLVTEAVNQFNIKKEDIEKISTIEVQVCSVNFEG